MTVVLNYDHQWDIDGLIVGREGVWKHQSSSGFDMPEYRISDEDKPQDHGMFFLGDDYLTGRYIEMTIVAEQDYGIPLQDLLDELKATMAPRSRSDPDMLLRWRYAGKSTRRLWVRPLPPVFVLDEDMYHGALIAHLRFRAADPFIYDDEELLYTITPNVTSGGLSFPHTFPHGFGSTSGSQEAVDNIGNAPTAPYGTITGIGDGINRLNIQNLLTGEFWSMTTELNGGDELTFDFKTKTVLLNGTASRSIDVDRPFSTWWKVPPGGADVGFTVEPDGSGSASLDFRVRSAWW